MLGRRLSSFTFPFLLGLLCVAVAGATTLAVTVAPQSAGTASAPHAQALNLDLSSIGYANGRPSQTLTSVTEALPVQFRSDLGAFGSCSASDFQNLNNDPPPCPADSEVGTTNFGAYVPSLLLSTTAAGYIYKISNSEFMAWVHITKPTNFSVALTGKLTGATTSAGPTISWNLAAAIDFGVTADITSFDTDYGTHSLNATATKPKTTTKKKTKTKSKTKKTKTKTKSKSKSKSKSKKTETKAKKKKKTKANGVYTEDFRPARTAAATVSASAFESTGCPTTGAWAYGATLHYKSGSSETVSAQVTCGPQAPATTTTTTTTTTGPCLLGVCLPAERRAAPSSAFAVR